MNKKTMGICIVILLLAIIGICLMFFNKKGNNMNYSDKTIRLTVNGATFAVSLANNSSSEAFYEKLKEGNIVIEAEDYGSFEKVGDLGFELPRNDQEITTKPGDIILYQGNKLTLYYAKNTYNFTLIGSIKDTNESYLKTVLGSGNVTLIFSL